MGGIFGGSKSKQTSSNQAYGYLKDQFGGLTNLAQTGSDAFSKLLSGDTSGFNAFKQATGFDAAAETGSRGITGNAAAGGMLRSGGTSKALQNYGNQMQNQYANSYLDKTLAQANMGYQAGQIIGSAGNTSTSQSKSKGGIGGFLGSALGGIAASDRRLKRNIHKIGQIAKGALNLYQFRYLDGSGPYVGVMADEVARVKPEALGPVYFGYNTVNYSLLEA